MIVEYIRYKLNELDSEAGESAARTFEAAYRAASLSLDTSPHCHGYELSRCVEEPDRYVLRIEWDSVEGHMTGFRRSSEFAAFLAAIKPYIGHIEEMRHYVLTTVATARNT